MDYEMIKLLEEMKLDEDFSDLTMPEILEVLDFLGEDIE